MINKPFMNTKRTRKREICYYLNIKLERMKRMSIYEPKIGQITAIEIIGFRQINGRIKIGNSEDGELLNNFPSKIKTPYGIFQLEQIKLNGNEDKLPREHPDKNIEWGIYV